MDAAEGFGIYLHWPFCQSKCPYCDFNSHVAAKIDQDRWAEAFVTEIARTSHEVGQKLVSSIYFGGGTPSLMLPKTVDRILSAIQTHFSLRNDIEITLEANPGSVESENFSGYRLAGVNRVSMGFQALDDQSLRKLGRLHSVADGFRAFDLARTTFDRASFDLIYARQGQSLPSWREELSRALDLGPTHISLYQLTVEDGTIFAQRLAAGGLKGLPGEDLSVDLYEATQEICDSRGLPAYEVSNHAAPGSESRHNMTYWQGGDYLGIGPGAHGRLTIDGQRIATLAPKTPGEWLNIVGSGNAGELPREALSPSEWAEELILMGLRTNFGLDLRRLKLLTGHTISVSVLKGLADLGMVRLTEDRLTTTKKGRLVLNEVIRKLVATIV